MPFVKTRQAISCGIITFEVMFGEGNFTNSQLVGCFVRYQVPPHSPEMWSHT
jgi:hypothetical protein